MTTQYHISHPTRKEIIVDAKDTDGDDDIDENGQYDYLKVNLFVGLI